jgi:hypothetical protein
MTSRIRQAIRAFNRHTLSTMNPSQYEINNRPRRLV